MEEAFKEGGGIFKQTKREKRKWFLFVFGRKIPKKLQETLDAAFSKAFTLIFQKGSHVIEKTYRKEELEKNYQIQEYAYQLCKNRKSLKAFSKKAEGTGRKNLLLSGVSGVGMGILGIEFLTFRYLQE